MAREALNPNEPIARLVDLINRANDFFCHGRRRIVVPASVPAVTGNVSMKRMTRSALLRFGASHGCEADEAGSFPGEAGFGLEFMPRRPNQSNLKKLSLNFRAAAF